MRLCRLGDQNAEKRFCGCDRGSRDAVAVAAPVGFADSWMVMGEFGREMKQLDAMFSPTARYSIAGTLTQMENTNERTRVNLAVAHYNRLAVAA